MNNAQKAYLLSHREKLGGSFPQRIWRDTPSLEIPDLSAFDALLKSTGEREISTTMAFVRVLNTLCRDKKIGKQVVPIVPDESRTFGMEGMFRQLGIYNPLGQNYKPEDADQLMFYKESINGQVLQEGINEAGAMADWIAARHGLFGARRADDPVLHLLLHVRLPTDRRSLPGPQGMRVLVGSLSAAPRGGPR